MKKAGVGLIRMTAWVGKRKFNITAERVECVYSRRESGRLLISSERAKETGGGGSEREQKSTREKTVPWKSEDESVRISYHCINTVMIVFYRKMSSWHCLLPPSSFSCQHERRKQHLTSGLILSLFFFSLSLSQKVGLELFLFTSK